MGNKMSAEEQWYFFENKITAYYLAEHPPKREYFLIGDGTSAPNPLEVKNRLDELGENAEYCSSGLAYVWNHKDLKQKPVVLPAGCYRHSLFKEDGDRQERLIPIELRNDHYVKLDGIYRPLAADVQSFLRNESIYRKVGALYKRGLLLYGPPGEGKTSLIRNLVKHEAPEDAVVIFFQHMPSSEFLEAFKLSLSSRLKIFVFEELVSMLKNAQTEHVLDFMDGEKSIDRTLMIATTNYPERLPGNIINRPSRFDKMYRMGHPTSEERKLILGHYLQRDATEEETALTNGLSTASLKEVCFLTHLQSLSMEEATATLRAHSEKVKKDFTEGQAIGFED